MAGVLRPDGHRIGFHAAAGFTAIPVVGEGNPIILVQVVKGQGTCPPKEAFTDAYPRRYGHNVGMHVRLAFYAGGSDVFIVGDIGTEFVGNIIVRNCSPGRGALAFGHFNRHVDNGAAGLLAQLVLCVFAEEFQAGGIYLPLLQVLFIDIVFAGNIPAGGRNLTGSLYGLRAGNIAAAVICQLRVDYGACSGNTFFRAGKAQSHCRVHLGQGVFPRRLHIPDAGIGPALDPALYIVLYLTDGGGNACRDAYSRLVRFHPCQVHASGYLYVPVIGAGFHRGTAGIGKGIVRRIAL